MVETIVDKLQKIYKSFEKKEDLKLYYFCADAHWFSPEERGVIQDKVFGYLKLNNISYVHAAWGYGLFFTSQDLCKEISHIVNEENFIIVYTEIKKGLAESFKEVDKDLIIEKKKLRYGKYE